MIPRSPVIRQQWYHRGMPAIHSIVTHACWSIARPNAVLTTGDMSAVYDIRYEQCDRDCLVITHVSLTTQHMRVGRVTEGRDILFDARCLVPWCAAADNPLFLHHKQSKKINTS